ncbi:MAG: tetratricopeptide repeat protein [Pseudomonadota bacterium]|nr:tetratricopeptide repeat protein [Pseudomonadota bacterium]
MSDGTTQVRGWVPWWQTYLAAAFGAFCLGFGDLMKNGKTATVMQISEVIREHLVPGFGAGALVALIILVMLGIGYCWIQGPSTLTDAFNRGFSVFAILAVAASSPELPQGLGGALNTSRELVPSENSVLRSANAQPQANALSRLSAEPLGQVVIVLPALKKLEVPPVWTATLRNAETGEIVGVEQAQTSKLTIEKPQGRYLLEVDVPGYRRIQSDLIVKEGQIDAYAVTLTESWQPLTLQRLYGAESTPLLKLPPSDRYRVLGVAHFRAKDYDGAVGYYKRALAERPNDAETYNFLGYAEFRAGRFGPAEEALKRAIAINPKYFIARLNLAKLYCSQGQPELAKSALRADGAMRPEELKAAVDDGEFRQACEAIYEEIALSPASGGEN